MIGIIHRANQVLIRVRHVEGRTTAVSEYCDNDLSQRVLDVLDIGIYDCHAVGRIRS